MIHFERKDGIELDMETCNDPAKVEYLLNHILTPETYALMKARLAGGGEEIFFEFTGINKEEFPLVRHHLVHLDSRPSGPGEELTRGSFYIVFYVHKDNLAAAEKMAKTLKSRFKQFNDWNETNEHGVESNKFFAIPPMEIFEKPE